MKLPPKPHVEYLDSGTHTDYQEWEAWGRACAKAALEAAAVKASEFVDSWTVPQVVDAIRNIKVEDEQ